MVPAIVAAAVLFSVAGVATLFGFAARDAGVVLQESSLLMAPALKAETIGSLPAGTLLQVVEERDGWTRVRVAGTEGWTESAVIGT
jgi:SH3-like domain-containing protein